MSRVNSFLLNSFWLVGLGWGCSDGGQTDPPIESQDSVVDVVSDSSQQSESMDSGEPDLSERCEIGDVLEVQGIRFRCVPAGSFEMGCREGVDDAFRLGCVVIDGIISSKPAHSVTITRSMWFMETELSRTQGNALGHEPPLSHRECAPECSAISASWHDNARVANRLSELEALESCYACESEVCEPIADIVSCEGYRMPTEAEWEYAARGNEDFPYSGSLTSSEVAWHTYNSDTTPHVGCEKARNGFELCDMSGNATEWVNDFAAEYSSDAAIDPVGPASGEHKVRRGGSYNQTSLSAVVSQRELGQPDRGGVAGIRLMRILSDRRER